MWSAPFAFSTPASDDLLVAGLPTGTVTFLFSDVEGSTRLLYELGDAYADALVGAPTRPAKRVLRARWG